MRSAASDLGLECPFTSPEEVVSEEDLREVHKILFETHVIEGWLICPESGRRFPVKDGENCSFTL